MERFVHVVVWGVYGVFVCFKFKWGLPSGIGVDAGLGASAGLSLQVNLIFVILISCQIQGEVGEAEREVVTWEPVWHTVQVQHEANLT